MQLRLVDARPCTLIVSAASSHVAPDWPWLMTLLQAPSSRTITSLSPSRRSAGSACAARRRAGEWQQRGPWLSIVQSAACPLLTGLSRLRPVCSRFLGVNKKEAIDAFALENYGIKRDLRKNADAVAAAAMDAAKLTALRRARAAQTLLGADVAAVVTEDGYHYKSSLNTGMSGSTALHASAGYLPGVPLRGKLRLEPTDPTIFHTIAPHDDAPAAGSASATPVCDALAGSFLSRNETGYVLQQRLLVLGGMPVAPNLLDDGRWARRKPKPKPAAGATAASPSGAAAPAADADADATPKQPARGRQASKGKGKRTATASASSPATPARGRSKTAAAVNSRGGRSSVSGKKAAATSAAARGGSARGGKTPASPARPATGAKGSKGRSATKAPAKSPARSPAPASKALATRSSPRRVPRGDAEPALSAGATTADDDATARDSPAALVESAAAGAESAVDDSSNIESVPSAAATSHLDVDHDDHDMAAGAAMSAGASDSSAAPDALTATIVSDFKAWAHKCSRRRRVPLHARPASLRDPVIAAMTAVPAVDSSCSGGAAAAAVSGAGELVVADDDLAASAKAVHAWDIAAPTKALAYTRKLRVSSVTRSMVTAVAPRLPSAAASAASSDDHQRFARRGYRFAYFAGLVDAADGLRGMVEQALLGSDDAAADHATSIPAAASADPASSATKNDAVAGVKRKRNGFDAGSAAVDAPASDAGGADAMSRLGHAVHSLSLSAWQAAAAGDAVSTAPVSAVVAGILAGVQSESSSSTSVLTPSEALADSMMAGATQWAADIYQRNAPDDDELLGNIMGPAESGVDATGHFEACCKCRGRGDLLLCDSCPGAFHLSCLGLSIYDVPADFWRCPECKRADRNKARASLLSDASASAAAAAAADGASSRRVGRALKSLQQEQSRQASRTLLPESLAQVLLLAALGSGSKHSSPSVTHA